MVYKLITPQDLSVHAQALAGNILSEHPDIGTVLGVPRSGMMPASVMATCAGWKLGSTGVPCLGGGRRFENLEDRPKTLVVDDSINTGVSMRDIKHKFQDYDDFIYAAVYSTGRGKSLVDYNAVDLELPHYFGWHLFNDRMARGLAFDFDGVFCRDCTPEEDDDGERYLEFLKTASPLYIPKPFRVHAVITARLEKYREQTLEWMGRYGIKTRRLIMGPWKTKEQRSGQDIGEWKADKIREYGLQTFLESDFRQARRIESILPRVTVIGINE